MMITAIKSPIDRVLHLIIPKEFSFNTTITVNERLIDMSTTTPKNLDLTCKLNKMRRVSQRQKDYKYYSERE